MDSEGKVILVTNAKLRSAEVSQFGSASIKASDTHVLCIFF